MTDFQNTAAGGTNGAAVTAANSGGASGDAFDQVVTSGGAVTYDTSLGGGTWVKFAGSGVSGAMHVDYLNLNGTTYFRARAYAYFTKLPSSEFYLIWMSGATAVQASLGVLTTGKIVQRATGQAGTGNSGTVTIPLSTRLRFECSGTVGTSGTMQSAVYNGDSTTALDSLSTTGQNTGTAPITTVRFGVSTVGTTTDTIYMQQMKAGDSSPSFYGPAVTSNTPPTVTGPSTISTTGTTASITFSATDTTGTVSSFACVHQSNTAASTVTPTVGSPTLTGIGTGSATATFPITGLTANARYFFGGTATDSTGATSTTPVIARVDVTSTAPALRPTLTTSGYTIVGGGTATQALSAGTPNTRNLQSAAPAAGSTGSATFEPLPPGAVPVAFSVTGHATDATTSLTRTVRLYQSTTLIATRTGTINPTTDTTIGGTTTTSETAAITDRSGLRVDWVVS